MENEKNLKNKKKRILGMLIVGIILFIGATYAWLTFVVKGQKEINIETGKVDVVLVEQAKDLELASSLPLSDEDGKKSEAFTFYIQNNSPTDVEYTLKLVDNTTKKSECAGCKFIPINDIRYELVRKKLDKIDTLTDTREIDTGILKVGERRDYTLRIWLGEGAGDEIIEAKFFGKLELSGEQTEGVGDDSGANDPELGETLIPVVYDTVEKQWEVANVNSKGEWYDYEEQRWANAVVVTKDSYESTYKSAEAGTKVDIDTDILQMYVWIPRYSYAIKKESESSDYYGKKESGRTDTPTQTLPGEIDVKFIGTTDKNTGDGKYESGTPTDTDWYTPDAFTLGGKELSGLWVGKFEAGYSGAGSTTAAEKNTNNESSKVIIKPNEYSWRSINVSNIYKTVKGITKETGTFGLSEETYDSHAMKNSEWGAVAYLTQSQYGRYGNSQYTGANKEVYNNNYYSSSSERCKTGCSGMAPGASISSTCTAYDDLTDQGGGKGLKGPGASTTGNIYGIYDMSGGAYEYVMGNLSQNSKSSGFTDSDKWTTDNAKYFDFYTSTTATDSQFKSHAIGETSGWYGDSRGMVSDSSPWLLRGYIYSNGSNAGVFNYVSSSGTDISDYSFRVVLALKETA